MSIRTHINTVTQTLTIEIPLDVHGEPSASGKTIVIASTRGNKAIDLGDGRTVYLGLNLYRYPNKSRTTKTGDTIGLEDFK